MKKRFIIIYSLCLLLNLRNFILFGQSIPEKMEFANVRLVIHPDAVEEIKKNINVFTQNEKFLQPIVDRTDTYFPLIERILSQEKIPDDFKYLVLQESKLMADAQSTSFAEGFWQMKKETAESLGLKVSIESDERKHIILSTYAAAKYLKKNNETFNNWIYALLSYNLGLSGTVQSVDYKYYSARKMEINSKTHWYIIKAISTKLAFQERINKNPDPKVMLFEYKAVKGQTLDEVARANKVEIGLLADYNKWFKGFKIPGDKEYIVMVPLLREPGEGNPVPRELYSSNPNPVLLTKNGLKAIQAKIGDTYEKLAKDGGVSPEQLNEFNELSPLTPLYYGQICYLEKKHPQPHEYLNPFHTLSYGQSIWSISQDFGVQSKMIRIFNNLKQPTDLYPGEEPKTGQKVWLREKRPENQGVEINVKEEEGFSVDQIDLFQKDVKDTTAFKNMKQIQPDQLTIKDSVKTSTDIPIKAETKIEEPTTTSSTKEKENNIKPKTPEEEAEEYERQVMLAEKKKEKKTTPSPPVSPSPTLSPSPVLSTPPKTETKKAIKTNEQVLEPGAKYHEWLYGESLFDIAKKNNCTTKQLLIWNDLSANAYGVGKKLIIRTTSATKNETLGKPLFHIVKPQETLWKLSVLYSITLTQLMEWNGLSGSLLEPGQKLKVSQGNETEIPILLAENVTPKNVSGMHTVQQGENLFRISLLYKVSVSTLEQLNNLPSQRVYVGQKIVIKDKIDGTIANTPTPVSNNSETKNSNKEKSKKSETINKNTQRESINTEAQTHIVGIGETLFSISKKYSITTEQLKSWNRLKDNSISVDQQLIVSDSKQVLRANQKPETRNQKPEKNQFHIVKAKETLFGIAKMYNIKVEQLKTWNNIKNNEIAIGEQLIVAELPAKKRGNALPQNREEATQKEKRTSAIIETPISNPATHTVGQGENLAMVAKKYKVSVVQLKEWNKLKNLVVTKGQVLNVSSPDAVGKSQSTAGSNTIPTTNNEQAVTSNQQIETNINLPTEPDYTKGPNQKQLYYTVKEKETLYQIANNFKVQVNDLIRINNLTTYEVNPGQRLLITYYDEEKLEFLTHSVQQGETLYSIAQKYECKVSEIMGWNMKTQIDIKPGDQLKIRKKE